MYPYVGGAVPAKFRVYDRVFLGKFRGPKEYGSHAVKNFH